VESSVQRWLVIAGLWPLLAATTVNAQSKRFLDTREPMPEHHSRSLDFRLIQKPSLNRVDPPSTGFLAEAEVAPNARIGFSMISGSRPKLGPEWRVDGRSTRTRKPAVSFTFRF
jgi:hypothetical protein